MALLKLLVNDFYDDAYKLIAIHCRLEDYRLAFLLNQHLQLKLHRKPEDIDVNYAKASYSIFEWNNTSDYITWNLVSNSFKKEEDSAYKSGMLFETNEKALKTYHLLKEFKNADYFLKISNEIQNVDEIAIINTLKLRPQIITSYAINTQKIKSKDHLIF